MKSLIALAFVLISTSAWASSSHEGKLFDLTVSPLGLSVFGDVSISEEFAIAYHLDDDNLISLRAQNYPSLYDSSYSDWGSGFALGVFYQHYIGNSFNVKVGLSQGRYEFSQMYYGTTTDTRVYFQDRVTTLEGRIGNQWTWGTFTMGCDWFGVSLPIISSVTRDDGHFSNLPASAFFRFVQFHLGVSF